MPATRAQAEVKLQWIDAQGTLHSQAADIRSLDRTTAKLAASELLPFGQKVEIVIGDKSQDSELPLAASVFDVRPRSGGGGRITCRFIDPLSDAILDAVAHAGGCNRRSQERRPVGLDAQARPELDQTEVGFPIRVLDLSVGGCCVKSPVSVEAGHRIMICTCPRGQSSVNIPLRVQWRQAVGDHHLLGCAFCQAAGYDALAALVVEDAAASERDCAGPKLVHRVLYVARAGAALMRGVVGMSPTPTTGA